MSCFTVSNMTRNVGKGKDTCAICGRCVTKNLLSLGEQPLANNLKVDSFASLSSDKYDLSLKMCGYCLYVGLRTIVEPSILFSENTYLTGVSSQTVRDLKDFVTDSIETCHLSESSKVIDVASNDGTLLSFFKERRMETLGIDPSTPAFEIALKRGINTINSFFDDEAVEVILTTNGKADLITMTNIITHVAHPKNFLNNAKRLMKEDGSIVMEFYYFESMINNGAFDQIYHEHVSYFNLRSFINLLAHVNLEAYKVELVNSQGGSLRVFAGLPGRNGVDKSVLKMLEAEGDEETITRRYNAFAKKIMRNRRIAMKELIKLKRSGFKIAGYGASAKATVLINYLKLDSTYVSAIADRNVLKIGKFIPGTDIPIIDPDQLTALNPDIIIIFSWNIKDEIYKQLSEVFGDSVRYLTLIPTIKYMQGD